MIRQSGRALKIAEAQSNLSKSSSSRKIIFSKQDSSKKRQNMHSLGDGQRSKTLDHQRMERAAAAVEIRQQNSTKLLKEGSDSASDGDQQYSGRESHKLQKRGSLQQYQRRSQESQARLENIKISAKLGKSVEAQKGDLHTPSSAKSIIVVVSKTSSKERQKKDGAYLPSQSNTGIKEKLKITERVAPHEVRFSLLEGSQAADFMGQEKDSRRFAMVKQAHGSVDQSKSHIAAHSRYQSKTEADEKQKIGSGSGYTSYDENGRHQPTTRAFSSAQDVQFAQMPNSQIPKKPQMNKMATSANITQRSGQFSATIAAMGKTPTESHQPYDALNEITDAAQLSSIEQRQHSQIYIAESNVVSASFQSVFGTGMQEIFAPERLPDGRINLAHHNQAMPIFQPAKGVFQKESRSTNLKDHAQKPRSFQKIANRKNQRNVQNTIARTENLPYVNIEKAQKQMYWGNLNASTTSPGFKSAFSSRLRGSRDSSGSVVGGARDDGSSNSGERSIPNVKTRVVSVPTKRERSDEQRQKVARGSRQKLEPRSAISQLLLDSSVGAQKSTSDIYQAAGNPPELSIKENQAQDPNMIRGHSAKMHPHRYTSQSMYNEQDLSQATQAASNSKEGQSFSVAQQLEELKQFETQLDQQMNEAYTDQSAQAKQAELPRLIAQQFSKIPKKDTSARSEDPNSLLEQDVASFEKLTLQPQLMMQHRVARAQKHHLQRKGTHDSRAGPGRKSTKNMKTAPLTQIQQPKQVIRAGKVVLAGEDISEATKTTQNTKLMLQDTTMQLNSSMGQIDVAQYHSLSMVKQKLRTLRIETTQLEDQAIDLQRGYETAQDNLKMNGKKERYQADELWLRQYLDFLKKVSKCRSFELLCDRYAKLVNSIVTKVDEQVEKFAKQISERKDDLGQKIESLNAQIADQSRTILALQAELSDEQGTKNLSMMGIKVRKTLEELQQKMVYTSDEKESNFQTRSKLEQMAPSDARYELNELKMILDNACRITMPNTSEDLLGEAIFHLLGSKDERKQYDSRERFGQINEGSVRQADAQGALLTKVKDMIVQMRPMKKDCEVQTTVSTFTVLDDEKKAAELAQAEILADEHDNNGNIDITVARKMQKSIRDKNSQLQIANDKVERQEKEIQTLNTQVIEGEAHLSLKEDEIEELKSKMKIYSFVDLDKYRNLSRDNNVIQTKLKDAQKELQVATSQNLARLEACKEKDDQMIRLKLMLQRAIFNLTLDMQEVIAHTQQAKEGLGKEVEGFDEENYTGMQKTRMEQASKALQEIRRIRIGLPYDQNNEYQNPNDTEVVIDSMRKHQEELQGILKGIAVNIGYNASAFLKFLKKRIKLLKNSFKRQANTIKQIIEENEHIEKESNKKDSANKQLIHTLTSELRHVVIQMKQQSQEYSEEAAKDRLQKLIEKETKIEDKLQSQEKGNEASYTGQVSIESPKSKQENTIVKVVEAQVTDAAKQIMIVEGSAEQSPRLSNIRKPSADSQRTSRLDRSRELGKITIENVSIEQSSEVESLISDDIDRLVEGNSSRAPSQKEIHSHLMTGAQASQLATPHLDLNATACFQRNLSARRKQDCASQHIGTPERLASSAQQILQVKSNIGSIQQKLQESASIVDSNEGIQKNLNPMYRESQSTFRLIEDPIFMDDSLMKINQYGRITAHVNGLNVAVNNYRQIKMEKSVDSVTFKDKSFSPKRTEKKPTSVPKNQQRHYWRPKIAKIDKGVQVYDDDVIKLKYNWKIERQNCMVQTDDIILERLALEQHYFRKTLAFMRYFQFTKTTAALAGVNLTDEDMQRMVREASKVELQDQDLQAMVGLSVDEWHSRADFGMSWQNIISMQPVNFSEQSKKEIASTMLVQSEHNLESSPKKGKLKSTMLSFPKARADSPSFMMKGSSICKKVQEVEESDPYANLTLAQKNRQGSPPGVLKGGKVLKTLQREISSVQQATRSETLL